MVYDVCVVPLVDYPVQHTVSSGALIEVQLTQLGRGARSEKVGIK